MSVGRSFGCRGTVSFFGVKGRFCITVLAQILWFAFFTSAPAHLLAILVAVYMALLYELDNITSPPIKAAIADPKL